MQSYLTDPHLSTKLKQLTFRWRTRMIKVGWNYGQKEQCPLCHKADDTQDHLFYCENLNDDCDETDYDKNNTTYNIQNHINKLEITIRKREKLMEEASALLEE